MIRCTRCSSSRTGHPRSASPGAAVSRDNSPLRLPPRRRAGRVGEGDQAHDRRGRVARSDGEALGGEGVDEAVVAHRPAGLQGVEDGGAHPVEVALPAAGDGHRHPVPRPLGGRQARAATAWATTAAQASRRAA